MLPVEQTNRSTSVKLQTMTGFNSLTLYPPLSFSVFRSCSLARSLARWLSSSIYAKRLQSRKIRDGDLHNYLYILYQVQNLCSDFRQQSQQLCLCNYNKYKVFLEG